MASIGQSYWDAKIRRNIDRDKDVNQKLEEGWTVLRFWDAEINKHLSEYVHNRVCESFSVNEIS